MPVLEIPALNRTAAAFSLTEGGNCHSLQPLMQVDANQKHSNVMGKQTLAPLLSREELMVPLELSGSGV